MRSLPLLFASTALVLSGCATTPSGSPDQVATDIVMALETSDWDRADDLFAPVSQSPEYRERIYPVLYDAAASHYANGETQLAAPILRFGRTHYPDAVALREALLYCLFIERSQANQANEAQMAEMEDLLVELDERGHTPAWADLVRTQLAVDRGRLPDARESFDRFLAGWNGQPNSLLVYVEDVDRYLASH